MNFINNINLIVSFRRRIGHLVNNFPNIVHTVIGRRIDFDDVHTDAGRNGLTGRALSAGTAVYGMLTVHRSGKNLGDGCFSRSSRPAEKVRVPDPPCLNLISQRRYNMFLPFYILKAIRPEFPV